MLRGRCHHRVRGLVQSILLHWSSVVYYDQIQEELHNNLKCLNSRFGIGDVVQYAH